MRYDKALDRFNFEYGTNFKRWGDIPRAKLIDVIRAYMMAMDFQYDEIKEK